MISTFCVATEHSLPSTDERRDPPFPMATVLSARPRRAVWHRSGRKLTGGEASQGSRVKADSVIASERQPDAAISIARIRHGIASLRSQ